MKKLFGVTLLLAITVNSPISKPVVLIDDIRMATPIKLKEKTYGCKMMVEDDFSRYYPAMEAE